MRPRQPADDAREVFKTWQVEDGELARRLETIRDWMRQVSQYGAPRFGETATKLNQLRSYLVTHFGHEIELCERLKTLAGNPYPEIEAMRSQASHDHKLLLHQLDALIEKLDALEPPFVSWQAAMAEVQNFADTLEQHESKESKNVLEITTATASEKG
jgi:hypothetical protein